MDEDLVEVVEALAAPRLLVLGDVMLDRFTRGTVERVCPEAAALVLRREHEEEHPGGAAGVAVLARALGAVVSLAGVVGEDADGRRLLELLAEEGIEAGGVTAAPDRPTTLKERFVGQGSNNRPQQLLRVDREERAPVCGVAARQVREWVMERLHDCDAVLIADHDKGTCSAGLPGEVAELAAWLEVPVLVDPARGVDLARYRAAEALLPNRAEAAAVLGRVVATLEDGAEAAREMGERSGAAVLLKLDRDGMALSLPGEQPRLYPARARQVCDVTGAGDMVLAAAGLARAAGLPWEAAARLANLAAALKVERPAGVKVERQELVTAPGARRWATGKVVGLAVLEELTQGYRRAGRRVVLTNGCFDLLHAGHAAYLEEAAQLGDVLVVAVNGDRSVRRLKGAERPIVGEAERAALVAALECVDHVLLFDDDTPHEVLSRLRPDVLVKGGDYQLEEVVGREVVQAYGGRVCLTGRQSGLSTSRLIEAVLRCRAGAEE